MMNIDEFVNDKLKLLKPIRIQHRPKNTIYLDSNNNFMLEIESNKVYCSYYDLWSVLGTRYNLSYIDIQKYLKPVLEKYLNIKNITPLCRYSANQDDLKNILTVN